MKIVVHLPSYRKNKVAYFFETRFIVRQEEENSDDSVCLRPDNGGAI